MKRLGGQFGKEVFLHGSIQDIVRPDNFARQRQLAFNTSESFGAGEAVPFPEAGDLSFTVGGDDDSLIYSLVDSGLEEQRHVIDNDGVGVF